MENKIKGIEEILLMGPGPSLTHPRVYSALSRPTLGHLDPYFIQIMDDIKAMLQKVFQTNNNLTVPMSGTGSAGMEKVFVNLIEKGDPVLILINGAFGKRMLDIAQRLGADADSMDFKWGTPVTTDEVEAQLKKKKYKIVAMVHAETSTGVCNPAEEVGKLVKEHGAFYILDTVTSLGGMEVAVDKWHVDAIYSGTQKCLSCPPGLSPVSFSDRAIEKMEARKTKVQSWYLDVSMLRNYYTGAGGRAYHHTAPINMIYALREALAIVLEEGIEARVARHRESHLLLREGLESLGLEYVPQNSLCTLNCVRTPDGIDEASIRKRLLEEYDIEIGGGLGVFAGKAWRIGLMGHSATRRNIGTLLSALK